KSCEAEMDDDAEAIITNERYIYIASLLKGVYKKRDAGKLSTSNKIDRIVTNRWLALPIFAVVMWLVYYVSMVTIGAAATDWANDGLFGDGFHLFGIGTAAYEEAAEEFGDSAAILEAVANGDATYVVVDDETMEVSDPIEITDALVAEAHEMVEKYGEEGPDPADYGVWVPGIPAIIESGLDAVECADWLKGLILDGIVAGVGAVLGFVPQMLVLFIFMAFLEACGYMARIAFIMDRIFRRFGLSGKSFIPILVGTGCGVPGIMACRTIENERDRRMTIMTTTFIPCGAKVPFIALVAGAIFGGSAWVATSAYFIGITAIITSGIILKKTKPFMGEVAPFVMELPAYHWPTVGNVLRSMWERGWSFIKKAGTIILLSTIVIWFLSFFGWADGGFGMLEEDQMDASILAKIGGLIAWIFAPVGWGNWQAAVASITGLVAKENIVGTMGILYGGEETWANLAAAFTHPAGMSFLIFNLLCAPCFAAIGAIKREMNSRKWTWAAIGWQCGFAYVVSFCVYQFGSMFSGVGNIAGFICAIAVLAVFVWALFRKPSKA
ncbi:MAG: ferrous iron transporter B, partial [Spirochaetaceae bacterium]|nr:ferrous iron transporter B [Spirochaetaceae bacterium]